MPPTLPPYALSAPTFRFRALASLAGRAPIGGAREVALACFVAARLTAECVSSGVEELEARTVRCASAKAWMSTLALPPAVRTPATRCAEASAQGGAVVGRELSALASAAASFLDAASRAELDALAAALRG